MQIGDEDSRHSILSNHEDDGLPHLGTGMKMTLAKPIVFSPHGQKRDPKRKNTDLREIFNPDEDDTNTQIKKRKLVPLGKTSHFHTYLTHLSRQIDRFANYYYYYFIFKIITTIKKVRRIKRMARRNRKKQRNLKKKN